MAITNYINQGSVRVAGAFAGDNVLRRPAPNMSFLCTIELHLKVVARTLRQTSLLHTPGHPTPHCRALSLLEHSNEVSINNYSRDSCHLLTD